MTSVPLTYLLKLQSHVCDTAEIHDGKLSFGTSVFIKLLNVVIGTVATL